MAARKTRSLNEEWRTRIQASMLVNRLSDHAEGKIEMSATQIKAAEILLRKVAPDLASVEHSGEVETSYVARTPQASPDMDAWQTQFGPPPQTTLQ